MASEKRKLIYADTAVELLSRLVLLSEHEKDILNLYIDQCMSVDAVEVVCCKDCKFGDACSIREAMICTTDKGFCWRGERRADA